MSHDLLEQLSGTAVPPLPDDFDRAVHQRLNRTLVVGQLIEFVCVALPVALAEFGRATVAAALYTLSGHYPTTTQKTQR